MRKNDAKKKFQKGSRSPKDRRERNKREDWTDEECKGKAKSDTNDPAWYAQNPQLLRDAASIPFSNVTGVPVSMDFTTVDGTIDFGGSFVNVPGIMTLDIIPIPGHAYNLVSPINVAATAMYSFVRHANSGSANYNSSDLMIYCVAMGQVYSYLNWLQRVYGTCQLYANYNRYLPRAVVEAQGVNFDDLTNNLADFRYGVNSLIYKASSLACPADMPYFRRLAFLFSGIYSEGESIKDQLYMYNPVGFLQYSETTSEQGGSLTLVTRPGYPTVGGATVQQLLSYGNSLLNPILQSEDMNIMSGDILKAYQGKILTLQTLPEVYNIMPTTDLNFLEQFQNASVVGASLQNITATITQNMRTNSLQVTARYSSPNSSYAAGAEAITNQHILTTILVDPKPEDVMERTRLMSSCISMIDDEGATYEIYAGSEIVHGCSYFVINSVGNTTRTSVPQLVIDPASPTEDQFRNQLVMHCELENFKFHPAVYYSTNSHNIYGMALDFDNFAKVSRDTVDRMNEAALLSLFNVNSIARAE